MQDISQPLPSLWACIDGCVYTHRKEKIPTLVTRETDSHPAPPRALWDSVCAHTQAIRGLASFTLRSPGTVFTRCAGWWVSA